MAVERENALEGSKREDAVRAREQQLSLALQASRMVAWEWDRERNAVTTSDNLAEICGVSTVEVGEEQYAIVHPHDVERHRATVEKAVATGVGYQSAFRIIRPDNGAVVWMEERGTPVLDEAGRVEKLIGVATDITLRKQAEEMVRGQATLLDLTFDAILVRDFATDRIQLWNHGAEELYGFLRDEIIGHVSHEVLQTVHSVPVEQAKETLLRTGRWEGELVHTRRDGRRIVVESRWAVQTEHGRPIAILETNADVTERRQAEKALRQSEERYRTIVATANEGIWLVDLEANTVYANDRIAEMLGYTPEEMRHVGVLDCTFPEDMPRQRERIAHNLEGRVEQFDTRFRRKDGSELLVLGCTSPARDDTGAVVGALGMFTDITTRARTELERLELLARAQQARMEAEDAQQRLTLLANASSLLASSLDYETTLRSLAHAVVPRIADWCAVHLVDEDGTVRQVTVTHPDPAKIELARELEQRYPYDPDAPAGVPEVLRTGQPELVSEVSDELLAAAAPDEDLLRLLRELGLTSWMVVPLAARGHLLGAITLVAAESGRHYGPDDLALAEVLARRAALAVDNARLYREAQQLAAEQSAILSQMVDCVAMVDPTGRVTYLNESARRVTGHDDLSDSLETALTRFHITTIDGQPYPFEEIPITRALAHREIVVDAHWKMRRPDGTEITLQGSAAPVLGEKGELLGAVSTFRDVTAQIALEQQKEEFLSAVAHDLKTPLTSLKGLAQILQRRISRDGANPDQLHEGLARIEQNAGRMTSMINELLDLSRLQAGEGLELNRRPTDLVALVSQRVTEYPEASRAQRFTLQNLVPELTGFWDADRLERVVANLLSNAVKYSRHDTPITVILNREETDGSTWAVLTVEDRGIGIPAEDLPRIFERFHRGRNVGRETFGTGIGLSGARQIVEQHGGTIEVTSEEGRGSTFTVRLPLTSEDDGSRADKVDRDA